jgi:hypothetical protein
MEGTVSFQETIPLFSNMQRYTFFLYFCYNVFRIGDYMNNKGFAITTIVYAIVILLVLILFSVTSIIKARYTDQSQFINDVQDEITECLQNATC